MFSHTTRQGFPMKMVKIAGDCDNDDCPAVHVTDRGTVAVQGLLLDDTGAVRPSLGEAVVEIPLDLLVEAARATR